MTSCAARWLVVALACGLLLGAGPAGAVATEDPGGGPGAEAPAVGDQAGDAGAPGSDAGAPGAPGDDAGAPATPAPDATALPVAPNPYLEFGYGPQAGFAPEPPPPVVVGSGADALIRAPDLRGDNEPTLLERYGAQGLALAPESSQGDHQALNAVAAGLFGVATWLAQAVIAAFQWAFTVEVFAFLGDAVTTIVDALRDLLYAPFVQAAVVLAGLSLVWNGMVRRRGAVAVQGMVWTVVALTAAGVFFVRPAAVIDGANHFSTGLSRAVLAAVSVADPGPLLPEDPAAGTTGAQPAATFDGQAADTLLRVAGDRFWRVFIYEPWLVLQFGDPELGAPYGEAVLAARTITAEELEALDGDPDALGELVAAKRDEAAGLRDELLEDERMAAWFAGRRPVERAGVATLALIGVIVGGVLLVLVAAAILLAQIALLLLVLLGPVALLVGIHPGTGRVIALRWAELVLGVLLRRVALGALLAVVLVVNGVLLEASYPLGWFVAISLQALVVAAAVVYRKPFGRLFAPTTVPTLEVDGVRRASRSLTEAGKRVEQWRETRGAPASSGPRPRQVRPERAPAVPPAAAGAPAGSAPAPATRRRVRAAGPAAARPGDGEAAAVAVAAAPRRSAELRAFLAKDRGDAVRDGNGAGEPAGEAQRADRTSPVAGTQDEAP